MKEKSMVDETKRALIAPQDSIQSLQMDLFSQFLSNDKSKISNSIEIWEDIPKYFLSPQKIAKMRTPEGLASPCMWEYEHNGQSYAVEIQPALIKQKDGSYKAFFPSTTEEYIEEALKKILADQQSYHNPAERSTWVRFSLSMLRRELKARGRSRDLVTLKHSIKIMSSCILTFYCEEKEVWKGSILQDLVSVNRDQYLSDGDTHHMARFPLFISEAINKLEYRQFNYDRLMTCDEQLSRWIYKKLINRFIHANYHNTYHFTFSALKQSGLLQHARETDARKKVISSLEELVKKGVISHYTAQEQMNGRAVKEVVYEITPSLDFIQEQKASNKRRLDASDSLKK